jgi:2-dehydropantoate 2-reductase
VTRVGVLGAGAMGSYFGAALSLAGHDVVLVDVDTDRMSAIDRHGLTLLRDVRSDRVRLRASASPEPLSSSEVVIVLTKANTMERALSGSLPYLGAARAIVVIPNGLGCGEAAARLLPANRVIHGATAAGAVLEGDAVVRETVIGTTYLGRLDSPADGTLVEIADLLNSAGLKNETCDHVESWIWTKLLINVAFNAVTAVTGLRNGALVETDSGKRLLELILAEVTAVARASGVELQCEDALSYVTEVGSEIALNQSSMLQDLLRKRPTEVDFLNGAVADTAARLGIPAPVNEALTHLVHMKEQEMSVMASAWPQPPSVDVQETAAE